MCPVAMNLSPPVKSVQRPPASRTSSQPAAMSHGCRPISQYASVRPHATYARSSAAEPVRRMSSASPSSARVIARCESRCSRWRNGKPVQSSAPASPVRFATRMRRSFSSAPAPFDAVNSSSRIGSYTTPCTGSPNSSSAMETEKCGKPRR